MHADDVGDLGHRERLQLGHAFRKKLALVLDDLAGDALDGPLALLDRVDDEFPGAQLLAQVVALRFGQFALRDEVLVGVAEAQARDVVAVEGDLPFAVVLLDAHIGHDDAVGVVREAAAGRRVEGADLLDGLLDDVGREAGLAREVGDAAADEELEMIADDARGHGFFAALQRELDEQAVGEAGRADARRIEGLQQLGGLLHSLQRQVREQGEIGKGGGQIAAVVEAADEEAQGFKGLGRAVGQLGLLHQVLLQ